MSRSQAKFSKYYRAPSLSRRTTISSAPAVVFSSGSSTASTVSSEIAKAGWALPTNARDGAEELQGRTQNKMATQVPKLGHATTSNESAVPADGATKSNRVEKLARPQDRAILSDRHLTQSPEEH